MGGGETHGDNISDLFGEAQAENALDIDTSGGGDINRSNDIENEGLGATGILTGIFQVSRVLDRSSGRETNRTVEGWHRTSCPRR